MKFEELVMQLTGTTSVIMKNDLIYKAVHVVEDERDSENILPMFNMALNPHILFYRAAAAIPWELADGDSDLNGLWERYIEPALWKVALREVTKDAEIKRMFEPHIKQLNRHAADTLRKIVNKDLRCGVAAKTVNNAIDEEFIPEDAVQLSNICTEKTIKFDNTWYSTPKLDGFRAYYDGPSKFLRSRQGKAFYGLEKIEEYCAAIAEELDLYFLDGELLVGDGDFSETQSIVPLTPKSDKYTPEAIAQMKSRVIFCIFACGKNNQHESWNTGDMIEHLSAIANYICDDPIPGIQDRIMILINDFHIAPTMDDVYRVTKRYVEAGFEGSMWRCLKIPYEYKRSNALLKFKFMGEAILKITGIFPGKGKYEGMAGGIVCEGELPDRNNISMLPIQVEVGSGFDDETRKTIDKSWIGREVCIYYQDITQSKEEAKKKKDGKWSLRFPVFHGFEDEK